MGSPIVLFTRPECELCDRVAALARLNGFELQYRDISNDVGLLSAYGDRIPVLQDSEGRELAYPFDADRLLSFLKEAL